MNQRLQDCGANGKGAMHRAIPAPDIVTGGSIGAITAAILVGARSHAVETLEEMWSRFSVPRAALIPRELAAAFSIFETQGMYRPGPGYRGAVSRDQHL